jgi:glycosyltransferase involved in cell wall biosynthesis
MNIADTERTTPRPEVNRSRPALSSDANMPIAHDWGELPCAYGESTKRDAEHPATTRKTGSPPHEVDETGRVPIDSPHQPLNVLVLHNAYKEAGGEDQVFDREVDLLRDHGHNVKTYLVRNDEIDDWSISGRIIRPLWNREQYRAVDALLCEFHADIVHVHNFYAVLSPSVYYAVRKHSAAIVQSLHNYRIGCANASFWRDGHVCLDCLKEPLPWSGIFHACYRGSYGASLSVTAMNVTHRFAGTWRSKVDAYIVMTQFARDILVRAGLPQERLHVKPNFTRERSVESRAERGGALFVARLCKEKGADLLLDAWKRLDRPLRIIGDGPLMSAIPRDNPAVEFMGRRSATEVAGAMAEAAFLVMPSTLFETFGLVIIEAYAARLPVLASRLGAMAELVEDGRTGLLFEPGNIDDLAAKAKWAFDHPIEMAQMGTDAYAKYRESFTPEKNYSRLLSIYHEAIAARARA